MQSIRENADSHIKLGIIGNKIDLAYKRVLFSFRKVITLQKGIEMGTSLGLKHYESSAKTKDNVNDLFHDIIGTIVKDRKDEEASQEQEKAIKLKKMSNEKKKKNCC